MISLLTQQQQNSLLAFPVPINKDKCTFFQDILHTSVHSKFLLWFGFHIRKNNKTARNMILQRYKIGKLKSMPICSLRPGIAQLCLGNFSSKSSLLSFDDSTYLWIIDFLGVKKQIEYKFIQKALCPFSSINLSWITTKYLQGNFYWSDHSCFSPLPQSVFQNE